MLTFPGSLVILSFKLSRDAESVSVNLKPGK